MKLTNEQLEAFEKISLVSDRSVSIPTMQLRDLVRELRAARDLLDTPMPCGWDEPQLTGMGGLLWDGEVYNPEEVVGLGATLMRVALKAQGRL